MNYDELAELAVNLKLRGCNCAQSVTVALGEDSGLPRETLMQLSAGFCAGMGNMEASCGALIGAVMAAGWKTQGKATLRYAKLIQESFVRRCGALRCRDLKGVDTGEVLCPCPDCVKNAVLAYGEVFGKE